MNNYFQILHLRTTRGAWCLCALALTCCWGSRTSAQSLVDNLGGALVDGGSLSFGGQITQIAFLPGDDTHAYITTFGSGILRYDYDPTITNFLSNPTTVVPASISSQSGVDGSLGIAFHEDATLGTVMYIAPTVPFTGGGGLNDLHNQSIVRLTDTNGDGIFGNHATDLNQNIVNNVNVSQVHQINQLQIRGDTLYAAIGIRTQNGGQTAAENQAIGGSGVDQSSPGETEYTGTVSFIENLNNIGTGTNSAGFSIANNQTAIRSDTQAFTSTADNKLRVFATGFRNNYGIGVDDSGEIWVSYNQNENPNAEDELHRNVTFQSDHQFFKGSDVVGNWKDPLNLNASAQAAQNAGYFDNANSVAPFELVGFNTAAGGLDFFSQDTTDASLRGDVLLSRNSGSGSDVLYVDEQTGNSFVVLEGLGGALEVQRDPFGNFLAGGSGRVSLIDVVTLSDPSGLLGDFNNDAMITVADWNLFKPFFGSDTSGLDTAAARLAGDLDVSGLVDLADANRFAEIFDGANGIGSFKQLGLTVPEPATAVQMFLGMVLIYWQGIRRSIVSNQ